MPSPESEPLPVYEDLAAALQRCNLVQSPAELHGFALGLYVGEVAGPLKVWQAELYAELDPADVLAVECRHALDRLFAGVPFDGGDEPMQLALLLPSELAADRRRLGAVRDWCQGFLFGFGLGGEVLTKRLSSQAKELLADFAEFTRLDTEDVEDNADNLEALIEIEEYLREGVMLIRDELTAGSPVRNDEPE